MCLPSAPDANRSAEVRSTVMTAKPSLVVHSVRARPPRAAADPDARPRLETSGGYEGVFVGDEYTEAVHGCG